MNTPWVETTLGEIAEIVSGATPSTAVEKYWGGDVRWVTPKDLSDLETPEISETSRSISEDGLRSCAATMLPANSVLLSSRAPIGLVAINSVPMATNQGFKSFVPDGRRVEPKFLYWWLKKNRPLLESLGNGATFKEISKKTTAAIPISLPPVKEQLRIASILDAADALRSKRRQALEKIHTLKQSIFVDMFGAPLTPPVSPRIETSSHSSGWRWVRLVDVAELTTGHTPDRKVADYWNGPISWVNLNEIHDFDGGICTETAARISDKGVANSSAVVLPKDTVCFSRTASIGFVTIMGQPMATSQDFVNFICGGDLNPRYLMDSMIMSRPALRASSSGSTHKTIYMRDAERFHVLLPPRGLQDSYVQMVGALDEQKRRYELSSAEFNQLFVSLQQRAFRGEL